MPKKKKRPAPSQTEVGMMDPIKDAYKFIISMKFALILLIVIALVSILGTIYQQGEFAYTQYVNQKPQLSWWYGLLKTFGIFDLYNAWWYLTLLGILMFSLTFCSIDKIKGSVRRITNPRYARNEKFVSSLKNSKNFITRQPLDNAKSSIRSILKKKLFYVRENEMGKGVVQLAAVYGRFGALGSVLFHLSFIILAIGILYGGIFGFEGYGEAIEGETLKVQSGGFTFVNFEGKFFPGHNPFDIYVEDFKVTFDNMGFPKAFASTVEAKENNKIVKKQVIKMNQPLIYNQYKVYQQSYGWAPEVEITDKKGQKIYSGPQKYQGDPKSQVLFTYNLDNATQVQAALLVGDVASGNNPKLNVSAIQNGQNIFSGQVEEGKTVKIGDYNFNFKELKSYTGLSFVRNPGITVIYIGFIILTLGTIVALYIHEKRVWVMLIPDGQQTKIRIGGSSERNKVKFQSEFSDLVNLVRQKK